MTRHHAGDVSGDDLARVDRKADEFEEAWRRGERPSIEDYLGDASDSFRTALLEELLMIEWQRRLPLGEQPVPEAYEGRFPEHALWIREALSVRHPGPGTTVGFDPSVRPTSGQFPHLSEYELLELIGKGGMGIVYRARKRSGLVGDVALKMIAEGLLSRENVERFITEMRNQERLQHPHIVQVLDSGQENGRPYFTMIFYRGFDLAHVLEKHGPLEPRTAALYVSRIAWAVRYLHDQEKLLHRDLKLKNILLDHYRDMSFPFGRPYLADFGLADLLKETSLRLHRGVAEGTVPNMSPEQVEVKDVGPASDVWGLGVILFECLTGRLPFRGETTAEIKYQIINSETPSLRTIRPGIPRVLERICLKCLKKSPDSRYRSASELIEDLECYFQNRPLKYAQPEATWERIVQWAWRARALAARLAVIVACSAIIWSYRMITGRFAPLEAGHPVVTMIFSRLGYAPGDPAISAVLVWANQVILVTWGLISWAFQRQLDRSQRDGGLQLGWRIADVVVLVLLIQLDDALMSPLTVAFAVLIVASAFWSRANQIIQTTLLSMAGYILLVLCDWLGHHYLVRPYRHFHYLVGLALLGVMLTVQANRTRALAKMWDTREQA